MSDSLKRLLRDTDGVCRLRLYGIGVDALGLEVQQGVSRSHTITDGNGGVGHDPIQEADGAVVWTIVAMSCAAGRTAGRTLGRRGISHGSGPWQVAHGGPPAHMNEHTVDT
jgi:hypothetical protein